jgi:hypothetical protein
MSKERFPSQTGNSNEDIQGDGFVVRGQNFHDAESRKGTWIPKVNSEGKKVGLEFVPKNKVKPYAGELTPVEFRPGESTDKVKERVASKGKKKEEERELIDSAEGLRARILKRKILGEGSYSERLNISPEGDVEVPWGKDSDPSLFSVNGSTSPEALMAYAQKIQDRFPDLIFNFKKDPEGKWIEFTVSILNDKEKSIDHT